MKIGCFGFIALIVFGVVGGLLLAGYFLLGAILDYPQSPEKIGLPYSTEDGLRAQQKLAELLLREARLSSRRNPITITQPELNSFLAQHLRESRGIPFSPLVVRLRPGEVEVQGGARLGLFLEGSPWRTLISPFAGSWLERKVWVSFQGKVPMTPGGRVTVEVTDFSLGKQPLPASLFRWTIGLRAQDLLSIRLPKSVEQLEIEEGRVVIRTGAR